MGLDVYAHRAKNLDLYNKYLTASFNYNNYNNFLWHKYEKEVNEAYDKYCEWEEKHQSDKNYDDEDNPYSYNINTFASEEEQNNDKELATRQECAKMNCDYHEIENLYMRKHYWFIQYLYSLNMDQMFVKDGDTFKTFDGDDFILKKSDVKVIIDKLKNVINKTNLVSVFDEYQPVSPEVNRAELDREFPILQDCIFNGRPDWNYSLDTIKHYLNAFKDVYNDMADDELLVYTESW